MRKLFLAMIASLALAVAACGPGAEDGQQQVDPQPPQPGGQGQPGTGDDGMGDDGMGDDGMGDDGMGDDGSVTAP
ncbi:MAG TPA: hypothetical protein VM305_03785 [Candidatus Limnocylindrales bacterium]|nr:hypothetical protein [Candidatus Limnocylindrales bacterium]